MPLNRLYSVLCVHKTGACLLAVDFDGINQLAPMEEVLNLGHSLFVIRFGWPVRKRRQDSELLLDRPKLGLKSRYPLSVSDAVDGLEIGGDTAGDHAADDGRWINRHDDASLQAVAAQL